ncbi:MAG: YceD family protein [Bacillota bacterium]
MIIDLTKYQEKGSYTSITGEYLPEDIDYFQREITVDEPLDVRIDVYADEDEFVFTGKLKGDYQLACTRCLDQFNYSFEIDMEFLIEKSEIDDLAHVDLNDKLKENLILTIPSKAVCSPDCKGICSQCGQNLNIDTCDCEKDDIDPRLEKLGELYDKE